MNCHLPSTKSLHIKEQILHKMDIKNQINSKNNTKKVVSALTCNARHAPSILLYAVLSERMLTFLSKIKTTPSPNGNNPFSITKKKKKKTPKNKKPIYLMLGMLQHCDHL